MGCRRTKLSPWTAARETIGWARLRTSARASRTASSLRPSSPRAVTRAARTSGSDSVPWCEPLPLPGPPFSAGGRRRASITGTALAACCLLAWLARRSAATRRTSAKGSDSAASSRSTSSPISSVRAATTWACISTSLRRASARSAAAEARAPARASSRISSRGHSAWDCQNSVQNCRRAREAPSSSRSMRGATCPVRRVSAASAASA